VPKISDNKREILKSIIRELHEGASPEKVKERFKEFLGGVSPTDVAKIEEELIREGLPREEIRRLCDVHLAVFRESLERRQVQVPPGHPVHTFMEEHNRITQFLDMLKQAAQRIGAADDFRSVEEELEVLKHVAEHLMEVENHNVREENVLFPYLEKHGIREPPAVMWQEHYDLREKKKRLAALVESHGQMDYREFANKLGELAEQITSDLSSHIYKENNILYPAALRVIPHEEWLTIKKECDELGYCCFTPEHEWPAVEEKTEAARPAPEGRIAFETGALTAEEVESILNSLPFDITFVDREDTVRYFSQGKERIFPRTKAVIGRKVQQCHPQKSIHVVNQILEDFRAGRRDSADFWIDVGGRKIYIRYFPVRNGEGEYLGCLEVTQDITEIQGITGEKRLL